jgi:hypothetical protein
MKKLISIGSKAAAFDDAAVVGDTTEVVEVLVLSECVEILQPEVIKLIAKITINGKTNKSLFHPNIFSPPRKFI